MLRCMARESREVWAERVKRWRESGQSAQEFAAAMGFNVWTLRKWSDRFRREGAADPRLGRNRSSRTQQRRSERDSAASASASAGAVPPLAFVEMLAGGGAASAAGALFEIVLRSGVIVRVPARFEPAALAHVLAAVGSR
jgi:transposase-like protein